ncbi:hypothetical protein BGZ46_010588 [Entomortierella lignicola]|nr:hypothetical protein BGZ46_010588 [Entomortierella lignicola]
MYQGIELSNIEFKRLEVGDRDLAIQNRKNVCLARCIQEVHASFEVKDNSIFMADIHEFAIAGKTTSDLAHLPWTAGGLKAFMRGGFSAIYLESNPHKKRMTAG